MKFTASSSDLLKSVVLVSKAVPAKTTKPILEKIHVALKGNNLELTATDEDLTIKTSLEVTNNGEDGAFCISAAKFTGLLKEMPDMPLDLEVEDDHLDCKWLTGQGQMPTDDAADFPQIVTTPSAEAVKVTFPATDLQTAVNSTIFAADSDPLRPVMNGILFDITPESTILVATDAHKLVCFQIEAQSDSTNAYILSKRAAKAVTGILDANLDEVVAYFEDQKIYFCTPTSIIICRQIIGRFPNYKMVIPKSNENVLTISRTKLLGILRRIATCADRSNNNIRFDLEPGAMTVTSRDLGFSISAIEKIECDYQGEKLSIGFKCDYIIEIVSNFTCDEIQIKFADARKAALFIPSAEEENTENICAILMPSITA